jgi:hypothetical protein
VLHRVEARARLPEVLSAEADGEKGYQIAPPAMLLEQVDTTATFFPWEEMCLLENLLAAVRQDGDLAGIQPRKLHK